MKWTLTRGADRCEAEHTGTFVFVREQLTGAAATETTERCFDDDEARAWAEHWLDERLAAGWAPSEAMQRAEATRREARAKTDAKLVAWTALVDADDPSRAVREYLDFLAVDATGRERLATLCARVERVDHDFTIRFAGGGRLVFGHARDERSGIAEFDAVLDQLGIGWLYDDDSDDHRLFFGLDAGPPEMNAELSRTPLARLIITWAIEESPWDRYWLFARATLADTSAATLRCFELDGGLRAPVDEPFGTLLLGRMLEILDRAEPEE